MSDEVNPMDAIHEYYKGFPEAPASDSFKWVDTQGFEHLSTVRAWSPAKLIKAIGEMQAQIIATDGKPMNGQPKTAPAATIQATDEQGLPVVDGDGNPVPVQLPKDIHQFTVASLFHDITKSNKDVLKVVTAEEPYNTKYGVACFRGGPDGWKNWPTGTDHKFAPPQGFGHVLIEDPKDGGKYANVIEFRP